MTLHDRDFDAFFAQVNDGHEPFAWQRRLFDQIVSTGRWPDQIGAPTGAGKSSVVEVHLFAVALFAAGRIERVPRRLALVVNRRALVDGQAQRALTIRAKMGNAERGSMLGEVAATLQTLRAQSDPAAVLPVFDIVDLRGGVPPRRDWVADPAACQIICATPDMWGSRVLFRGYGASRLARPREAGLLVHDAAMVLDEAHLNRQLLVTARRVAQLGQAGGEAIGVPALQVVATTATPADGSHAPRDMVDVSVAAADMDNGGDDALRRRLTTPKKLTLVGEDNWPPARGGGERVRYVDVLVDETLRLREDFGPTVGCFVNTVALAAEVTTRLRAAGLCVELLVGRMRPYDRDALEKRRPGVLTVVGNPDVDVLVATQTLEVGVDVDLSALVTELAPATALAQRAGRVNRLGLKEQTEVCVIGPSPQSVLLSGDLDDKQLASLTVAPYTVKGEVEGVRHLQHTWGWLTRHAATPDGLAPWSLRTDPPPVEPLQRPLLQRLEPHDTWYLSRTAADLFDDPDLELWLRDSLDPERLTCGVVTRAHLPIDESAASAFLNATPPADGEIYPAVLGQTRQLLDGILAHASHEPHARAFLSRDNEIRLIASAAEVKAGDIVILDAEHTICTEGVVTTTPTQPGSDIYEEAVWHDDGERILRFVGDRSDWEARLLEDLAELCASDPDADDRQIADLVQSFRHHDERIGLLTAEIGGRSEGFSVAYGGVDDPPTRWLVIAAVPASAVADAVRQVWSPARGPILLDEHNSAVGHRAGEIAERVGLHPALCEALADAGRRHDTGKRDNRFQRFTLGNADAGRRLLAKSQDRSIRQLRDPSAGGLPSRWRHEQLSAALAATELHDAPQRDLILRLVGTSHGHGRPTFPHTVEALLGPDADDLLTQWARRLFDVGEWDDLVERTHHRWGVWACAYLEALLRGADAQVSGEGR